MDPVDLKRYVEKFSQTLGWCFEYFTKLSESHAAEHVSKQVFYSPICQRIKEALDDLSLIQAKLELDEASGG